MFQTMRLQTKLVVIGCLLVIIPLAIVASMTYFQNKTILNTTIKETMNQAYTDLDHIAESVYNLVESHQEVNEKSVKNSLNVAREIVAANGGFSFEEKPVAWNAVNQLSQASSAVELPRMKVGKTGYVYILDGQGRYVISKDGKRDGEDISASKDSAGNLFIQEIVKKALVLKPREIAEQQYPWLNQGETKGRMKIARIMYFAPWDWIIGVGSYQDEFMDTSKSLETSAKRSNVFLLSVLAVSLAAAVLIWLITAKRIVKPIVGIIEGLNDSADKVSCASGQISASSQSLAQGASEQAASIEESSASLEQMSSMTKNNAENAAQADKLMKKTNQVVGAAKESMQELTTSIREIALASEETSKIVKTIDEIAFQTNLLALNAAVEAARAGEAGAGFAVVADEVRNLAMRAADAAKNTAGLIEGTIRKSQSGSGLVVKTNEAFIEVTQSSTKVGELVAEIASASIEQAQGIEQVNNSVAEMDKVVQQNAAQAEEVASASEELLTQAEQMKTMVNGLILAVEGTVERY